MGRQTGAEPSADQTFLWRICHALDEPPRVLAKNLGIPYKELEPLLSPRHRLEEIDRGDVWWRINAYVDQKLGYIMAVRNELQKALQADRVKRAARIERFRKLHDGNPYAAQTPTNPHVRD